MLPKLLLVPQETLQDEERTRGTNDKSIEGDQNKMEINNGTDNLSMADIESALVEYSIIFNELIRFVNLIIIYSYLFIYFCRSLPTYLFTKGTHRSFCVLHLSPPLCHLLRTSKMKFF